MIVKLTRKERALICTGLEDLLDRCALDDSPLVQAIKTLRAKLLPPTDIDDANVEDMRDDELPPL